MNRATVGGDENPAVRLGMRPNTFGEFLHRARMAKYMPRARLARLTGLPEKTIAGFELNRTVPSAEDIKKLAAPLGLTERDLLIRAGCINPERTFEGAE